MTGHTGLDSSTAPLRAARYTSYWGMGEILAYGQFSDTAGEQVIT